MRVGHGGAQGGAWRGHKGGHGGAMRGGHGGATRGGGHGGAMRGIIHREIIHAHALVLVPPCVLSPPPPMYIPAMQPPPPLHIPAALPPLLPLPPCAGLSKVVPNPGHISNQGMW